MLRVSAAIVSMCLTLFLWWGGCWREQPAPPPVKKTKIVIPIKRPAPEKAKTEEKKGQAEIGLIELLPLKTLETLPKKIETAIRKVSGYRTVNKGDALLSPHGHPRYGEEGMIGKPVDKE